jgi:hypothetical protein
MPFSFTALWITISTRNAYAIAGAWTLLALSRRWKPDPGWIDRLGRLLGSCWIGWMLFWMLPAELRSKILSPLEGVFQW